MFYRKNQKEQRFTGRERLKNETASKSQIITNMQHLLKVTYILHIPQINTANSTCHKYSTKQQNTAPLANFS